MNAFESNVPPVIVPPPRPRVWPVFVVYAAAVTAAGLASGIYLVVLALVQQGSRFKPDSIIMASRTVPGLLGSLVVTMVVLIGAAVTGALLSPVPWRDRLRLRRGGVGLVRVIVGSLGVMGIALMFKAADGLGVVPESPVLKMLEQFMQKLTFPELLATVVVIGMLPGIAEEVFFRGYIQTRLSQRWGARWAVLWTALLFGVMHFDLVQGCFAVGMGVFLGYLTERSGTIVPAMIAHATNNTLATLLSAGNIDVVGRSASLWALVIGAVIVAGAMLYLRGQCAVREQGC